jgi:hypothetical protein
MILTAIGWLAALGLLAAAASSGWHGARDKARGPWIGAGLYACAAVILLAAAGALAAPAAAALAFAALALAGLVAAAEGPNAAPDSRWRGAAWSARYSVGSGARYLGADTRGLAGWLHRRWQEYRAGDGPDLASEPAPPIQPTSNGAGIMPKNTTGNGTRPPAGGTVKQPGIRARRLAASAGTVPVPAGWAAVVAGTADFEADSNVDLAQWMTEQVLGLAAWAEAVVEQHETNRGMGVDPAAISMLHDVAEAGVGAAQAMAGAVSQFCNYFELPDAFVDAGGQLAHSGDWHQGSPG